MQTRDSRPLPLVALALLGLWTSAAGPRGEAAPPAPSAASAGGWTTGAQGTLPDPSFGPGAHLIDLAQVGTYDAARWAVVLDYQSFTVQSGATVRFANHPTRAMVVIRSLGAVVIDGELVLDGARGHDHDEQPVQAEPGPGGFRGGLGLEIAAHVEAAAGHGPGGGFIDAQSASCSGGNFGGAGSGGALHFVAPPLTQSSGLFDARRGSYECSIVGGSGWIRVECENALDPAQLNAQPAETIANVLGELVAATPSSLCVGTWRTDVNSIWNVIPADPEAQAAPGTTPDGALPTSGSFVVRIECSNVLLDMRLQVRQTDTCDRASVITAHLFGEVEA